MSNQFKPGKSGNKAGRPKGSPNRLTRDLKESIADFLRNNWEGVQENYDRLNPRDRMQFVIKLLEFELPRKRSVDATEELRLQLEHLSEDQLEAIVNKITQQSN